MPGRGTEAGIERPPPVGESGASFVVDRTSEGLMDVVAGGTTGGVATAILSAARTGCGVERVADRASGVLTEIAAVWAVLSVLTSTCSANGAGCSVVLVIGTASEGLAGVVAD